MSQAGSWDTSPMVDFRSADTSVRTTGSLRCGGVDSAGLGLIIVDQALRSTGRIPAALDRRYPCNRGRQPFEGWDWFRERVSSREPSAPTRPARGGAACGAIPPAADEALDGESSAAWAAEQSAGTRTGSSSAMSMDLDLGRLTRAVRVDRRKDGVSSGKVLDSGGVFGKVARVGN